MMSRDRMESFKTRSRRILVFEYLHASSTWYRDASESMKAEGLAMLLAVIEDLKEINIAVCVAICPEARHLLPKDVEVVEVDGSDTPLDFVLATMKQQIDDVAGSNAWDAVLPIAPECDDTLVDLVNECRRHDVRVLAPRPELLKCFSDKWATYQFLRNNQLPTPPTELATNYCDLNLDPDSECVLKPNDGAGCEGIEAMKVSEVQNRLDHSPEMGTTHIVQPRLEGVALSMGLIGAWNHDDIMVLPLAKQEIHWSAGRPAYQGSTIPTVVSDVVADEIQNIAEALATTCNSMTGYVGVDLFVPDHSTQPLIMEINPRLCSSYISYRRDGSANLMAQMFRNTIG